MKRTLVLQEIRKTQKALMIGVTIIITLIGEQPNPWDLLKSQDVMSRHQGANPPRGCELLGAISLIFSAHFTIN